MIAFLFRKLSRAFLTLLLVVSFAFLVLRVSGDPTEMLLPDDASPELIAEYRTIWGLDKPLSEQFINYCRALVQGDFGISLRDKRPALEVVAERIPATLKLTVSAFFLAVFMGVPLGIVAAYRRNSAVDRFSTAFSVVGYSMPNFFLGILLILLFSLHLRVLPSAGHSTFAHMIMPLLTLGTSTAGIVARFTRSAVLEVLEQPYIKAARAKGLTRFSLIVFHIMPNAAIPIITILGFQLGGVVGGALVTETVFAWPGIGRLLVQAVGYRDLAVVQTIVLLIAASMVFCNLCVDALYGVLDPRIRSGARKV